MLKQSMKCTVIAAVVFCFAMMAAGVSFAGGTGPEDIVLQGADAKKPANFPHKKHQATIKCEACHHTQTADGKQGPYVAGQEKKCESCHNKDFKNAELNSLKGVGHARCKGCHKDMEKEGKNAPTKCTGCHTK
jgi:predicted CXXCH cytochrome family protein